MNVHSANTKFSHNTQAPLLSPFLAPIYTPPTHTGSNQMRVWSVVRHKTLGAVSGLSMTLTKDISTLDDHFKVAVYRDHSVCLPSTPCSTSATVFYGFRGSSEARLRNARTGALEYRLPVQAGCCIAALAVCSEYYVCAARGSQWPVLVAETDEQNGPSSSGAPAASAASTGTAAAAVSMPVCVTASQDMSAVSLLLYSKKTVTFVRRVIGCRHDQVFV